MVIFIFIILNRTVLFVQSCLNLHTQIKEEIILKYLPTGVLFLFFSPHKYVRRRIC